MRKKNLDELWDEALDIVLTESGSAGRDEKTDAEAWIEELDEEPMTSLIRSVRIDMKHNTNVETQLGGIGAKSDEELLEVICA